MKINGNDSGAHAKKKGPSGDGNKAKSGGKPAPRRRSNVGKKIALIICCALALVCAAAALYMLWEKPPERGGEGLQTIEPTATPENTEKPQATSTPEPTEDPNAGAPATLNENMYTFLVVGIDRAAMLTDVIMVGRLDTEAHEINVVSIPRDTLVNKYGSVKKVNTYYNSDIASGGDGVTGLMGGIKNLLGFEPDCYAVVDLEAFVELVDAIGGVDYDVPVAMHYHDPTQDLYIDLEPGMQHLNGQQAMGVVRFRSGYASADIGRIGTQQDFLMSVASQFLTLGNIPNLPQFIEIFTEYVDTNMTTANLAFFARQFLLCSAEDIHFQTMPANYGDSIKGVSYVSIYLNDWLEMVNECLNPYDTDVTAANVNILTHSSSGFYSTVGYVAGGEDSFYNNLPASPSPSPSPEVSETPEASEAPQESGTPAESQAPAESLEPSEGGGQPEGTGEAGPTEPVEPTEPVTPAEDTSNGEEGAQ